MLKGELDLGGLAEELVAQGPVHGLVEDFHIRQQVGQLRVLGLGLLRVLDGGLELLQPFFNGLAVGLRDLDATGGMGRTLVMMLSLGPSAKAEPAERVASARARRIEADGFMSGR